MLLVSLLLGIIKLLSDSLYLLDALIISSLIRLAIACAVDGHLRVILHGISHLSQECVLVTDSLLDSLVCLQCVIGVNLIACSVIFNGFKLFLEFIIVGYNCLSRISGFDGFCQSVNVILYALLSCGEVVSRNVFAILGSLLCLGYSFIKIFLSISYTIYPTLVSVIVLDNEVVIMPLAVADINCSIFYCSCDDSISSDSVSFILTLYFCREIINHLLHFSDVSVTLCEVTIDHLFLDDVKCSLTYIDSVNGMGISRFLLILS